MHTMAGRAYQSLGVPFRTYTSIRNMHDLDQATLRPEMAVSIIPQDHPNQAQISFNLGNMQLIRHKRTGKLVRQS